MYKEPFLLMWPESTEYRDDSAKEKKKKKYMYK